MLCGIYGSDWRSRGLSDLTRSVQEERPSCVFLLPILKSGSISLHTPCSKQAMFTEPADQSVWWYHHFLLTWAEEGATSADAESYENVLRAEAATLEELIEVEGRCKVRRYL